VSDKLSGETQKKIIELCRKISVSHNLDDEIREELFTHMEDKLLGYVNGDVALTEEDAFILVREHFGDAAVIRTLYREIEEMEVQVSFARRIGAALAASLGIGIAVMALGMILRNIPYFLGIPYLFLVLLISGCIWGTFIFWQKQIDKGLKPWFLKVKPVTFFSIIIALILIRHFMYYLSTSGIINMSIIREDFFQIESGLPTLFFYGLAWLWWCDTPARRIITITSAFLCWFSYGLLLNYLWIIPTMFKPSQTGQYITFIPFYFRSVVLVPVIYIVIVAIKTIRSKWQPALNR